MPLNIVLLIVDGILLMDKIFRDFNPLVIPFMLPEIFEFKARV